MYKSLSFQFFIIIFTEGILLQVYNSIMLCEVFHYTVCELCLHSNVELNTVTGNSFSEAAMLYISIAASHFCAILCHSYFQ